MYRTCKLSVFIPIVEIIVHFYASDLPKSHFLKWAMTSKSQCWTYDIANVARSPFILSQSVTIWTPLLFFKHCTKFSLCRIERSSWCLYVGTRILALLFIVKCQPLRFDPNGKDIFGRNNTCSITRHRWGGCAENQKNFTSYTQEHSDIW